MIWIFKELNKFLEAKTGIPCRLPGLQVRPSGPSIYWQIKKTTVSVPDFGQHQSDEQINNGDLEYAGPSILRFEMDLILNCFGNSPEFANKFFLATLKLEKALKVGFNQIPLNVTENPGGGTGAGLEMSDDWGQADLPLDMEGITGTLWGMVWPCVLVLPIAENYDYLVQDFPAEEAGETE